MKRSNLIAALVGFMALVAFANEASAYYHADMGRFVSRDPVGYGDGMSLYQYARSRPIRSVDPMGLDAGWARVDPGGGAWGDEHSQVAVECTDVPSSAGIIKKVGRHCSVVGGCKERPTLRWEDAGARAEAGEGVEDQSGHPDKRENLRKKERPDKDDYLDHDNGYPGKSGWQRYAVTCDKEKCPCAIYDCLKDAVRTANFVPYSTLGPNSNTFAHALLNRCGCEIKPWKVAIFTLEFSELGSPPQGYWYVYDEYTPDDAFGWNYSDRPEYWSQ